MDDLAVLEADIATNRIDLCQRSLCLKFGSKVVEFKAKPFEKIF